MNPLAESDKNTYCYKSNILEDLNFTEWFPAAV